MNNKEVAVATVRRYSSIRGGGGGEERKGLHQERQMVRREVRKQMKTKREKGILGLVVAHAAGCLATQPVVHDS